MKAAWLIMAVVAAVELYRNRSADKRARYWTMSAWLLSLGYAGIAAFSDRLPLPVWIIRGLFGWADAILRVS